MIKELKKEELKEDFFDLYYEGFLFHYNHRKDLFKKRNIEELKEYVYEGLENGLKILGIIEKEKLLGYIAYEIKEKVTKCLWIDEFVIKEEYRHKGYGTKLMERINEITEEEKINRIELNCYSFNENAIKLYKKLGYTEQRFILEKKKGE